MSQDYLFHIHQLLEQNSLKRGYPVLTYFMQLLERLGNPHKKLKNVIHVAGTNGKGSVVAYLNRVLQCAGYKVHATTSPHLTTITERIQIANKFITEEELLNVLEEVIACSKGLPITYFEYLIAVAFACFYRHKADYTLLETGLGGRLDATNCIEAPLASVVTSISIDHQDVLGSTLKDIATEKAGIIKPGVPVFTCPQPIEVEEILRKVAEQNQAPFHIIHPTKRFDLGLLGEHQQSNAALVEAVLKDVVSEEVVRQGFKTTQWPGRLQKISYEGKDIWVDIAHNEGSIKAVLNYLDSVGIDKFDLIFSLKKNRDPVKILPLLLSKASSISYVEQPDYALCHDKADIDSAALELGASIQVLKLEEALGRSKEKIVLITGSTSIVQQFTCHIQGLGCPRFAV